MFGFENVCESDFDTCCFRSILGIEFKSEDTNFTMAFFICINVDVEMYYMYFSSLSRWLVSSTSLQLCGQSRHN